MIAVSGSSARGTQCFKCCRGIDRSISSVSQLLQERRQQLLRGHVRVRTALNMRALLRNIILTESLKIAKTIDTSPKLWLPAGNSRDIFSVSRDSDTLEVLSHMNGTEYLVILGIKEIQDTAVRCEQEALIMHKTDLGGC